MTAAPASLRTVNELAAIRLLLRDAHALGARFRLSGALVEIDGFARLPSLLQAELQPYVENGWLWIYLDGEEQDLPALELGDQLGVAVVLVETREQTRSAVRRLIGDIARHGGTLGLDIETAPQPGRGDRPWAAINADGTFSATQPKLEDRSALDPHLADIATMQLYAGGTTCFIFRGEALKLVVGSHWLRRQHLVAHNLGFELKFLQSHSRDYRPPRHRRQRFRIDCSMQGTGLLTGVGFGGTGRSLATAAKVFLDLDVPKDLQTSDWAAARLSAGQLAYASSDAVIAWRLWPILREQLYAKRRWGAYDLQRRAIGAVADMELRGLGIDRTEHQRQVDVWSRELAEARRQYFEITQQPPPATQAQVRSWLAQVLEPERLARWWRTPTGELSTAADDLKRLSDIKSARPVLAILAKEKLLSTFGAKFADKINPVTGRLHTSYLLAGTKAGRFSASGPNLQQLPSTAAPEFKRCIVAAPGYRLIGCDWSQIEMRAAAWISGDRALTRVYSEGRDLHAETAASVARVPVDQVTKEQRQAAKPVNFGAIYGIGPTSLAANAFADYGIDMSEGEARQALDRFFATYHTLDRWRRDHADLCQRRGYVEIGAGRVVEARWEASGRLSFPQCCNLPVQGICADAMLRALTLAHTRLREWGIRGGLVASIHDELLLEVHEDDADIACVLLEEAMIEAFAITFPGAPTTGVAKAAIGASWAEVKQ